MDNFRVTWNPPDVRDARAVAAARAALVRANLPRQQGRRLDFGRRGFDPNNQPDGQVEHLGNQVNQMNLNH